MKCFLKTQCVVGLAMLAGAGMAVTLKPTHKLIDQQSKIYLETMIPVVFAEWKMDKTLLPLQIDSETQAKRSKLYNQTLVRTYVNHREERIMLSIAYGGDQRGEETQVHRPENCYQAQGFELTRNREEILKTSFGTINVKRLVAKQDQRNEPITYWITVGDRATLPGLGRKWLQFTYGVQGIVPDGMLVRISSIDLNENHAYLLQNQFINDLLNSLSKKQRLRVVGKLNT